MVLKLEPLTSPSPSKTLTAINTPTFQRAASGVINVKAAVHSIPIP